MRWATPLMFWMGCSTPMGKLPVDSGKDTAVIELSDEPSAGDECEGGGVLDCTGECWVAEAHDFIGDGTCDSGERGPDFNCADTDFDGGDCQTGDDATGADTVGSDTAGGEGTTGDVTTDGGTGGSGVTGSGTTGSGTIGSGTTGSGATDDPSTGGEADDSGEADDATTGGTTDAGDTEGAGTDASATTGGTTDAGATSGGSGGGATGEEEPAVGDECFVPGPVGSPAPGVFDCRLECVSEIYAAFYSDTTPAGLWMDGNCDDGEASEYADFDCSRFGRDGGDCPDSAGADDWSGSEMGGDDWSDMDDMSGSEMGGDDWIAVDDGSGMGGDDWIAVDDGTGMGGDDWVAVDDGSGIGGDDTDSCTAAGGTTSWMSDGMCDSANNIAACDYDGGDCCEATCIDTFGYDCGPFDCIDPSVPPPEIGDTCTRSSGTTGVIDCNRICRGTTALGDGACDDGSMRPRDFDCPEFDDDDGDCGPCYDVGGSVSSIGDGVCDVENNSPECEYDGGDCEIGGSCTTDSFWTGILDCDLACIGTWSWDPALGDGICDGDESTDMANFNCAELDYDDGDCSGACYDAGGSLSSVGDSTCDAANNIPECEFDGGDCCEATCSGFLCGPYDCRDPSISVGESCDYYGGEGIYDCNLSCESAATVSDYLEDEYCDDSEWGIDLNCEEFGYDSGWCLGGEDSGGWLDMVLFPESPV